MAPKGSASSMPNRGFLWSCDEGGQQERGKRAGTENVPGIVGMAAALSESVAHLEETGKKSSPAGKTHCGPGNHSAQLFEWGPETAGTGNSQLLF